MNVPSASSSATWFGSRAAAVVAGTVLVVVAAAASGQDTMNGQSTSQTGSGTMMGPAPILVIYREDVKVGKVESHERLESEFVRAYAQSDWGTPYLAMTSVTGPTEAWFLAPYQTLDALEQELRGEDHATGRLKTALDQISAREADELEAQRSMIAMYRQDLSMNPPTDVARDRYVSVATYHVRPGHDMEFEEAAKMVRGAYEKSGVDMHWTVYQVLSGAPSGTYLVLETMKRLAGIAPVPARMKMFETALGTDGHEKLAHLSSAAIAMSDRQLFAFDPKMSYPPAQFTKADPEFWKPVETTMARVGTSGKTEAKKRP